LAPERARYRGDHVPVEIDQLRSPQLLRGGGPLRVIDVYEVQAPTPPAKGERQVVIVLQDMTGRVEHQVVAFSPSKSMAQTVRDALRAYYRV
jgi:hypothetical protein